MSRIRSLHPGLFTDDRYMALSLAARELLKGIWCEADDQGVFEWRPLTLKARIMPADSVDVDTLLDELSSGQFVTRFECDGRSYGAVRNFRRFQRPKKPKAVHLLPAEFVTYVGLAEDGSEPPEDKPPSVPHQFPTEGEKPPQMEDGGGRRGSDPNGSARGATSNGRDDPAKAMFDAGVRVLTNRGISERQARGVLGKFRGELHDDGKLLSLILAVERECPIDPVGYLRKAVEGAAKPSGTFTFGIG